MSCCSSMCNGRSWSIHESNTLACRAIVAFQKLSLVKSSNLLTIGLVWSGCAYYLIKRPLISEYLRSPWKNGGRVEVSQILVEIDNEIARLQQARDLLAGKNTKSGTRAPYGAAKKATKVRAKRKLSPEGRRKIAEAMKRRWAERRKEMAAKAPKSAKA